RGTSARGTFFLWHPPADSPSLPTRDSFRIRRERAWPGSLRRRRGRRAARRRVRRRTGTRRILLPFRELRDLPRRGRDWAGAARSTQLGRARGAPDLPRTPLASPRMPGGRPAWARARGVEMDRGVTRAVTITSASHLDTRSESGYAIGMSERRRSGGTS